MSCRRIHRPGCNLEDKFPAHVRTFPEYPRPDRSRPFVRTTNRSRKECPRSRRRLPRLPAAKPFGTIINIMPTTVASANNVVRSRAILTGCLGCLGIERLSLLRRRDFICRSISCTRHCRQCRAYNTTDWLRMSLPPTVILPARGARLDKRIAATCSRLTDRFDSFRHSTTRLRAVLLVLRPVLSSARQDLS